MTKASIALHCVEMHCTLFNQLKVKYFIVEFFQLW